MKKKCLSLLLMMVMLVCAAAPLSASAEGDISLYAMNYAGADLSFTIDRFGMSTIVVKVTANANTERIETTTWLERYEATANGLKWVRKSDDLKYDAYGGKSVNKTWKKDLANSGEWRAVCAITVYGRYDTEGNTIIKYANYNP